MSEKLAPVISDEHFTKMMALKPANARKHTFAGQLLMEAIDREYAKQEDQEGGVPPHTRG